jgi:hypothetical protein
MMNTTIAIELAPFNTIPGMDAQTLLTASDQLEREFLAKAEGYLGRVLVQKNEQAWADIVFWRSADHAAKAMESVMTSDACRAYFACMQTPEHDDGSHGVTLFKAMRTYGMVKI